MRDRLKRFGRVVRAVVASGWLHAFQVSVIIGGWAMLTWGVASLTVWQVWPISTGAFLLAIAGAEHLRLVFGKGLYALAMEPEEPDASDPKVRAMKKRGQNVA